MVSKTERIVGIVQARMGSTRLPGKVLADLCAQPMLLVLLNRVRRSAKLDEVVVATTDGAADDPVYDLVKSANLPCFRGSEGDLLDRYFQAAVAFQADVIVRLTGDNPLVDGQFVDMAIEAYLADQGCDYLDTSLSETFPTGLRAEVFTIRTLENAWSNDRDPASREHVTPYIYSQEGRFRVATVSGPGAHSSLRWTVDLPSDLAFVRQMFQHFGHDGFGWREALQEHLRWLGHEM